MDDRLKPSDERTSQFPMSSPPKPDLLDEPGSATSGGGADVESDGSPPPTATGPTYLGYLEGRSFNYFARRVRDESSAGEYDDGSTSAPAQRPGRRRPGRLATLSGAALLAVSLTAFGLTATQRGRGRDVAKVYSANEYYEGSRRSPVVSEPVRTPEDGGWHDLEEKERASLEEEIEEEGGWAGVLPLLQLDDDMSFPTSDSSSSSPSLGEAECPEGYEPRSSRRYRRRGRRNLVLATKSVKSGPDEAEADAHASQAIADEDGERDGDQPDHVPERCVRVDDTWSAGQTASTEVGKTEGGSKASKRGAAPG